MCLILNKIHINTKTVLACSAVIIAFALIVAPLAMSENALIKNKAKASISQDQSNRRGSLSVSGGDNILLGNNINLQNQQNFCHNVIGQSDD